MRRAEAEVVPTITSPSRGLHSSPNPSTTTLQPEQSLSLSKLSSLLEGGGLFVSKAPVPRVPSNCCGLILIGSSFSKLLLRVELGGKRNSAPALRVIFACSF